MKIKISSVSGFCMGVKKAIDNVLDAVNKKHGKIYVDGPVIHNAQVMELLQGKGVEVFEEGTPLGDHDTIIIRAHGVPPERERFFGSTGCTLINSTCPLVARIQKVIEQEREKDRSVVIVGEKGHPEVIGLAAYAGRDSITIESAEEVNTIQNIKPVAVVAQSTQNIEIFNNISKKIKEHFPDAVIHDTICCATKQRQDAVKELAQSCDAVLIVGSKNSGNTKRLAQIASRIVPTFHVETAKGINESEISPYGTVGIAGGASTPNWVMIQVFEKLKQIAEKKDNPLIRAIKTCYRFMINSNVFTALAGLALGYLYYKVMSIPRIRLYSALVFLYLIAMHTLNRYAKYSAYQYNSPVRAAFFEKTKKVFIAGGITSLIIAMILAASVNMHHLFVLIICSFAGVIYPLNIFPRSFTTIIPYRSLKDIPGSKDIFIGLGWAFIIVLFPAISNPHRFTVITLFSFVFIFLLVFIRSVLLDILDIPGDRITGNDTIPILLGITKTRRFLAGLLLISLLLLGGGICCSLVDKRALIFLVSIFYLTVIMLTYSEKTAYYSNRYEAMIDLNFILVGIAALVVF